MTTYARVDDAPPTGQPTLQITWARLPVLWWRDVAVTTREPVELNELDRFTIAAVDRLGYLHRAAFEQFTGLPPLVFAGLARRLHSLNLLEWRDDVLRPISVTRPRHNDSASRSATSTLDFLYLPSTDDLVVVGEGLGDWERAGPPIDGAAPLPASLHGVSVRTLFSERIAQRRVANLPDNVVALAGGEDEALTAMAGADPPPPLPLCPVVECAATVVLDGARASVQLEVSGKSRRRNRNGGPVTVDLSGATGLVAQWSGLLPDLATPSDGTAAAMRAIGLATPPWPPLRQDGLARWRMTVDGDQARTLAEAGPLTNAIGLEVRHTHARIVTALRLSPADREAESMIELDAVLQKALQSLGTGPPDYDATDHERLLARAWQLRYFPLVQALREAEDFRYA